MKRSRYVCFIAMMLAAPLLFAAPYDRNGYYRHHSPPPPHHHHHYHSNSGLRTAADIVDLVGASLATARVLTGTAPAPVVVAPAPQPVVVSQPVYVPVQSVPQPIQTEPAPPPQPRSVTINPDGTKTIKY